MYSTLPRTQSNMQQMLLMIETLLQWPVDFHAKGVKCREIRRTDDVNRAELPEEIVGHFGDNIKMDMASEKKAWYYTVIICMKMKP